MRTLILSFLVFLFATLSACRTSTQAVTESRDSATVEATAKQETTSAKEIISAISESTDIDISGLKIEFYPPTDSAASNARASPKTITIETASTRKQSLATQHEMAESSTAEDMSVRAEEQSVESAESATELRASSPLPSAWIIAVSLVIAILFVKFWRNR